MRKLWAVFVGLRILIVDIIIRRFVLAFEVVKRTSVLGCEVIWRQILLSFEVISRRLLLGFDVIRKRIVLGLIFGSALTYFLISLLSGPLNHHVDEIDIVPARRLDDSFLWHSDDENNGTIKVTTCRNSIQGKVLIVDDRGYVCSRNEVLGNGCCDTSLPRVKRYSCETCKENGCCSIYEYCISCCLHPDKKDILQNVLGKAPETFRVLFASVTDHFELCLAKCRTSSQSVQHENSYRDPQAKHCYGDNPPSTDSLRILWAGTTQWVIVHRTLDLHFQQWIPSYRLFIFNIFCIFLW